MGFVVLYEFFIFKDFEISRVDFTTILSLRQCMQIPLVLLSFEYHFYVSSMIDLSPKAFGYILSNWLKCWKVLA